MAVANIAAVLAGWGKKVLVIDWDLEAPGIEHFFASGAKLEEIQNRNGLIELLTGLAGASEGPDASRNWINFVGDVPIPQTTHSISLLTSGCRVDGYFRIVRKLDVAAFYEDHNGGRLIETLRNSWKSHYDFVLVDSRTGITDIGGVCTIQLPDILALIFTATNQSLFGAVDVALKAFQSRQNLPFDRALVPVLPIPSRFDTQTEHKISKEWLSRFETALAPIYKSWLPAELDRREFLELTKVPYTPFFSFGEGLPVVEQGVTDPAGMGYAYETLAALLANKLENADQLVRNRDDYVRQGRTFDAIPRTSLREIPQEAVLLIELVNAGALREIVKRVSVAEEVFAGYQQRLASITNEYNGKVAMSAGDSFLFAFATIERAVTCALEIQRSLRVSKPIKTPLGSLKIRMAAHASEKETATGTTAQAAFRLIANIVSKGREGQLLLSETAHELFEKATPDVEFRVHEEQLEFFSEDDPTATKLYEVIGVRFLTLHEPEIQALFKQDPSSRSGGGFQAFIVHLQEQCNREARVIKLTVDDEERIARYAHDYSGGGWQGRLRRIFGRTLGDNLGREL
jgi:class 3 adenylate cyclase